MKEVIKNTTLADRLLFFFLMVVSVSGIFLSKEAMSQGSDVVVEIDGKPAYTFPLSTNRTIPVDGLYGKTVIEISDKKVRVKEACCPNRLCAKQGWISRGAIVCLPNKIVVIVGGKGNKTRRDIDAITG